MTLFDQIWEFASEQIKTNSFLTGGGVLMVIGTIAAACRRLPERIWSSIKSQCVMSLEVNDRDPAFDWLCEWLAVQPYSRKHARRLSLTTVPYGRGCSIGDDSLPRRALLVPAAGQHYFMFKRRLLILSRESVDGPATQNKAKERIVVTVASRRRQVLYELIEDARRFAEPENDGRRKIWLSSEYNGWFSNVKRRPRPLESVILGAGKMEAMVADLEKFFASEDWYVSRGIPYRRTLLLYGPPGTGKSSAVFALACHFNRDLSVVNLASSGMTDDGLRDCLSSMPMESIGLIEDIDCVLQQRDFTDPKSSKLTFSGLLNALDGVAAGEPRVMFITTNHRDRLDEAILRPGRCDAHYELGYADGPQVCKMFDRFFPGASDTETFEFVRRVPEGKVSTAALQGIMLEAQGDVRLAIEKAEELCTS